MEKFLMFGAEYDVRIAIMRVWIGIPVTFSRRESPTIEHAIALSTAGLMIWWHREARCGEGKSWLTQSCLEQLQLRTRAMLGIRRMLTGHLSVRPINVYSESLLFRAQKPQVIFTHFDDPQDRVEDSNDISGLESRQGTEQHAQVTQHT